MLHCWQKLSKSTNQRVYQDLVYRNALLLKILTSIPAPLSPVPSTFHRFLYFAPLSTIWTLGKCFETLWSRGMQCFLFPEPAMRNEICYQTVGKAISAGFKTQTFQAHFRALSGKGLCYFKTFSCYKSRWKQNRYKQLAKMELKLKFVPRVLSLLSRFHVVHNKHGSWVFYQKIFINRFSDYNRWSIGWVSLIRDL